jgi:RNA polymerase sigma-70 factor (ECF subfamily)
VAFTLRTVGGFGVGEIARALLADERAVAQRLVRAKRTLRDVRAPFEMPSSPELPERLDAVLDVLYLMFNEGHTAHQGDRLLRRDLCHEALRLTELLLSRPQTSAPRVHALAALFCLHASRFDTRTDDDQTLVRLPDQDRAKWDRVLITRGLRYLDASASGPVRSAWHIEAGIAACHAVAPSWSETDWARIVDLYDELVAMTGSPVAALNRVVAIRELRGAAEALRQLTELPGSAQLQRYHLYHGVRGELLAGLGRAAEAGEAFRSALRHAKAEPVRKLLAERLARVTAGDVDSRAPHPS